MTSLLPATRDEVLRMPTSTRRPDDEVPWGQYGMLAPSAHLTLLAVDDASAGSPRRSPIR
ncbi:hypothetical protein [Prauserella flavalba]|uniref:Uncharacterized protein n=1 Tax=Prauserella flavalba TaxID=1477506 RepID=A0A318LD65_9PSEU|nr:hypothetical protein [Prauserella flavalba]PXY23934.1 hypothetical protein BA062_27050 [Prauserella flavalba]